ncbi:TonB-dependent receptor plug domain-containing protein [Lysobacter gummosus]|uniref:TonB-dependent receptor n=1 Tax=Lysobacter gummosus TaxID=262324 RepID=A0ABY3XGC3_9GAMM|nr:TonB-dependent receptor [Lysobacter gummosus]ALN90104.1 tonB dependent receptor family protein [Lysobacter gummosus]UNP30668.1 TonB-dependent receptor [Lysobacter gummosus]
MTLKTTKLRDAIVFALCVGATSLAGTGLASAQDAAAPAAPAAEDATTLDRIQVTGSRISIPGLTTNSPVMTVSQEEIARNQPVTAEDFLKIVPGAVPSIGPGTNNGANGGATINLRGLGDNRTVVLMDGRRVVPFNLFGVVDTNVIPVALIDSVDLVTGGASAVYGADAVAGVVNFVLKRNFEGVEVNSSYGQSSKQDGDRRNTTVTMGMNLDEGRGNFVLSLGKTDNDPLLQGSRGFSEFNLDSTSGEAGGSGTSIPTRVGGGLGQINPATGRFDGIVTPFNYNPYNFNQTALDRWQATALGRYEINKHAEAYTQLLYTRSNVFSQIAPGGLFGGRFDLGIGNPLIPDAARQQMCTAFNVAAADCAVGSPTTINTTLNRRTTELGTRSTDFQNKVFQATVGVRGDINDNWRYDAYWSHGEADQLTVSAGFLSKARTQQALLSTDGVNCLDPRNGCIPLNLWGPEGSISKDSKKFLEVLTFATQRVEQEVWSGSVNGDLGDNFKSPWADYPIGLAFGLEGRKVDARNQADAASRDPEEVQGSGGANPDVEGNFTLREAYVETIVPLISGKTGAQSLNFEAGYRHSEFKSGQTDVDYGSYKYGLEWAPIESLRFRGMFQRATRAPNVNELFQPVVTGLDNTAVDPCEPGQLALNGGVTGQVAALCVATGVPQAILDQFGGVDGPSAGQANAFTGGNPVLGPEKADTQTLGLVWQPLEDLSITLDYWKIDIKDAITRPVLGDALFGCYDRQFNPTLSVNNPMCQLMIGAREAGDGSLNGEARGPFLDRSNKGRITTSGWDLGVRYGIPLANEWGRLDFSLDLTKTDKYDYQGDPLVPKHDCVGVYGVSCNVIAGIVYDYKSNFRAVWSIKDFELGFNWRHLSAVDVEPGPIEWFPDYTSIDAYDYFDLTLAYELPWNARINFTVNNIADKKPPVVGSNIGSTGFNSGNTFPQYYDTLGRYYTMGITMRF